MSSLSIGKLTSTDMDEICRICLSSSVTLMDMFTKRSSETETEPTLAQKIMECVRCAIKENDNLPQKICISCILTAETSFKFKRMCEQSHKILTSKLRTSKTITLDQPIILETSEVIEKIDLENTLGTEPESDLKIATSEKTSTSDTGERRDTQDTLEKEDIETSSSEEELANKATSNRITTRRSLRYRATSKTSLTKPQLAALDQPMKLRKRKLKGETDSEKTLEKDPKSDHAIPSKQKTGAKPQRKLKKEDNQLESSSSEEELAKQTTAKPITIRRSLRSRKGEDKVKEIRQTAISKSKFIEKTTTKTESSKIRLAKFQCPECLKIYSSAADLLCHSKVHSIERPHACPHCNQKFVKSSYLRFHMRTHTGEKPYECPQCDRKFARKSNLNVHIRYHNGVKPHECPHCDRKFSFRHYLRAHIYNHNGERPYECPHCNRRYIYSNDLRKHMRIHTGEKPFECSYCSRKFFVNGDLQKHIRVHTREKPYSCPHCDYKFANISNVHAHVRNKHKST